MTMPYNMHPDDYDETFVHTDPDWHPIGGYRQACERCHHHCEGDCQEMTDEELQRAEEAAAQRWEQQKRWRQEARSEEAPF